MNESDDDSGATSLDAGGAVQANRHAFVDNGAAPGSGAHRRAIALPVSPDDLPDVSGAGSGTSNAPADSIRSARTPEEPFSLSFEAPRLTDAGAAAVATKYRLVRLLGAGGMGEVFEAEQRMPKRRVAIKLLRRGMQSAALLRRFEFEMDILARMEHPGIARIYDAGTVGDGAAKQSFFVMEFVDGMPIDRHVREHKLDRAQIVQMLAAVADAVHHAHMRGIVHRDLKPANIFVDRLGAVRVLDFGIARIDNGGGVTTLLDVQSDPTGTCRAGAELAIAARTDETQEGDIVGTPTYMSPEQAAGRTREIDAATDVYTLGVIAYELLCGRHPFVTPGINSTEVLKRIVANAPTPPRTLKRSLSGDLDAIICRAMSTERLKRHPDAGALAADLRAHLACRPVWARGNSIVDRTTKFARRNRVILTLIALAGAAAAWVGAPYLLHRRFGLHLDSIKPGEARLVWEDRQRTETGFSLEYLYEDRWEPLGLDLPPNTTSKVIASLKPNTTYNFRVRANGPLGTIGWSDTATLVTPASALRPPSDLRAIDGTPTSIHLVWKLDAKDLTSSVIEFSDDRSRSMAKLVDLDPAATDFVVGGLTPGRTYAFRIAIEGDAVRAVSPIVRYTPAVVGASGK